MTPDVILIAILWVIGLLLCPARGRGLPWHPGGEAPGADPHPKGIARVTEATHRRRKASGSEKTPDPHHPSTRRTVALFAAAAVAAAGRRRDTREFGRGGVLTDRAHRRPFRRTVLALATSLPEISTGLQAVRRGDDNLAISDIFGGNAFLPVLFLVATVISGAAILPRAHASEIYLTSLAALLTLVLRGRTHFGRNGASLAWASIR